MAARKSHNQTGMYVIETDSNDDNTNNIITNGSTEK